MKKKSSPYGVIPTPPSPKTTRYVSEMTHWVLLSESKNMEELNHNYINAIHDGFLEQLKTSYEGFKKKLEDG